MRCEVDFGTSNLREMICETRQYEHQDILCKGMGYEVIRKCSGRCHSARSTTI